jgi:hypothetical protein
MEKDNFINNKKELEKIIKLIDTIKFGSIQIIIQDGKIIQYEINEKYRIK